MTAGMPERVGEQLGSHAVISHVADGSMGSVYEARDRETGDRVALKVLHAEVARDPVAVERFRREYETVSSLCHPHIVDARDFGQTSDGAQFMTMELLDGEVLTSLLARGDEMPPSRMIRIACQLALALDHAHARGVIHRDLKPDNVFVCAGANGVEIRVLDFGSVKLQVASGAKLTALGTTLGSPHYMSPEQAMGKPDVDPRADVFALAAILHEMATGQVAFAGDSVAEILLQIVDHNPSPVSTLNPDYPWAFDDVIKRGLRKEKTERFTGAASLAEAVLGSFGLAPQVEHWAGASINEIERALGERTQSSAAKSLPASQSPTSIPVPLPIRESRVGALGMGLAAILTLVLAAWFVLS